MFESGSTRSPDNDRATAAAAESELLISRMIDGEEQAEDRRRFEALANTQPLLWRTLALRQQDMAALSAKVDKQLDALDRIELPHESSLTFRSPWLVAFLGWAAVIVIVSFWGLTALNDHGSPPLRAGNPGSQSIATNRVIPASSERGGSISDVSPDALLQEYLRAPFVLGQMPPTLLDVTELSDGRKAVRILRRIEEVAYIPSDAALPVDENGNLTKPPEELRDAESQRIPE